MQTLIHADIFFFVTTIIVLLLGMCTLIIACYVIQIARKFNYIVEKVRIESDNVTEDIAAVRARIREEGMKASPMIGLIGKFIFDRWASHKAKKNTTSSRRKTGKADTSKESEEE